MNKIGPPIRGSHQRFRALRQNRGRARGLLGKTVRDRDHPLPPGRAVAILAVVLGLLAVSLPTAAWEHSSEVAGSGGHLASAIGSPPGVWNNGRVVLTFPTNSPSFSVAPLSAPSESVTQTLGGLAEVNASDVILSFASFVAPTVDWTESSVTGAQGSDVMLTATVPVVASGGDWESGDDSGGGNVTIGEANVTVAFALNASTSSNPWSVAYTLNVTDWPWLHFADSVGVEVRSNVSSAAGYWVPQGVNQLTEVSRSSQRPLASFVWGDNATARYSGGQSEFSSVGAYSQLSANGTSSLVRLEFGSVTGGYTSLSYDPWLAIIPAGGSVAQLAAWVVTPTFLAILAGGAAGTLVLAAFARSRRLPPESDL